MDGIYSSCFATLIVLAASLLLYFYYKVKKAFRYFPDRNIPYIKPNYFDKESYKAIMFQETIEEAYDRLYKKLNGNKLGGFYRILKPAFIIRDPEIVERILIKDFSYFQDHNGEIDLKTNPLDGSLFNLKGDHWKHMRTKLSPIFTSGKLKWMFGQIETCGNNLVAYFGKLATGEDVTYKEALSSYGMDVIASCAFGIDAESLKNPNSQFMKMANKLFHPTIPRIIAAVFKAIFPKISSIFKIQTFSPEISDFFLDVTKSTIMERIKHNQKRADFVQLLMELKLKGSVESDEKLQDVQEQIDKSGIVILADKYHKPYGEKEMTDEILAAQSFIFFLAGYETVSTLMAFSLYQFSTHPEVQSKVRDEIKSTIEAHGGITYEALQKMTYLECCMSETLRMFSPAQIMVRECTKDYKVDDSIIIEKSTLVFIPIYSLHYDEQYFDQPQKFIPERFIDSKYSMKQSCGFYLPFGDGPRVCIARRFAILETKMALVKLLLNFEFERSPKNVEPLTRDPKSFIILPRGGLHIRIHKLNK